MNEYVHQHGWALMLTKCISIWGSTPQMRIAVDHSMQAANTCSIAMCLAEMMHWHGIIDSRVVIAQQ